MEGRDTTPSPPTLADLRTVPLTELEGVGPVRAARLAQLGLSSVHDLVCTAPRKFEPWPQARTIAQVRAGTDGSTCVLQGRVTRWSFSRFGGRSSVRCHVLDESGEIVLVFFNQPWMRQRLAKDMQLRVAGRANSSNPGLFVVSRLESESAPFPSAGELVPTYPSAEGVSQVFLRELIEQALERFGALLDEPLSPQQLAQHGLRPLPEAVREVHRPKSLAEFERALRRVQLEPLVATQRRLLASALARRQLGAPVLAVDDRRFAELVASFPFAFTAGQHAIAAELRADLSQPTPMRRLLQGDVGAGKTALGALACWIAASSGAQAAFMAPTELLAEQHFASLAPRFAAAGVSCALLTGSTPARERRSVCERLARGELAVLIGTHALFSSDIVFARLALAVVDEQHRFGVAQRERLFEKGGALHGLLMTATPIPRSLALTLYGDLEVSVLRERPPGRGELVTRWAREGAREFERDLEARLERGEQLYWVAPRIDSDTVEGEVDEAALAEDEAQAALGAEQRFARIASRRWSRWGVELAHGRMKSAERAARLERFRRGEARILVATTVIEVGVDVPAASAIVIESCERLGLAQLHQLRGRVGRGAAASVCYLLGKPSARRRLELLERTRDGFEIAEEDLRERGMGDLAGVRQAGENREGFEPETSDVELIALARTLARASGQTPGAARPLS
jgi:ATP-dependent DNA helicase RecG